MIILVYGLNVKPSCRKSISKACKKNNVLGRTIKRKMEEIKANPYAYKPLKHGLKGERRVHVLKSFVLKFEVNESSQTVTFLTFDHHDDAYRR